MRNLGLAHIGAGEHLQSTELLNEDLRILGRENRPLLGDHFHFAAGSADESYARNLMNLAVAFHAIGDRDRAIELLKKALVLDPRLEEGYIWMLEFHRKAGRAAEAPETVGNG